MFEREPFFVASTMQTVIYKITSTPCCEVVDLHRKITHIWWVFLLLRFEPFLHPKIVESLLICVFFLAPRDQLLQRNKPATSQAAGYPKQPATSSQPATPAL
jgi:hypothetical protein